MLDNEINDIIVSALRSEFDRAYLQDNINKQIRICKVCIKRGYKEAAEEMKSDLLTEYNIELL